MAYEMTVTLSDQEYAALTTRQRGAASNPKCSYMKSWHNVSNHLLQQNAR